MKNFLKYKNSSLVVLLITGCIFILIQCMDNGNKSKEKPGENVSKVNERKMSFQQFAGTEKCIACHKEIYDSFIHTSHYLTSVPASEKFIKGSFQTGKNIFPFHPGLYVEMEKRDSGYFQVAYLNGVEKIAKRFDIVVGSGAKGQTYLSWVNNELFQLPISYLTLAGEWANSPGYPNKAVFNRPITSRCLECHSTYAKVISPEGKEPEEYDHNEIVYGVTCEKCHGPGEAHVAYETNHPEDKQGKYIINTALLSRQRSLDLCALCHGGRLQKSKPSFEFVAGDTLSDFFVKNEAAPNTKEIDVHGNQLGLLEESKCFLNSATMTCITCHDNHSNNRGNEKLYSLKCMTCHNIEHGNFCKTDRKSVV